MAETPRTRRGHLFRALSCLLRLLCLQGLGPLGQFTWLFSA
eukprot:SAG25_NODE_14384_length_255_cov_1.256410_1_plen_40_part_01